MHIESFRTLADLNRLRIVELLRGGERAVNDLVAEMDIHQSGVSRHLGILEREGFVQVRAEGTRRLYSLRPERFRELDEWLAHYRELWLGRLEAFEAALERRQRQRGATRSKRRKER